MKRGKIIYILSAILFILILSIILYITGISANFSDFLQDYIMYVNSDIENQAKLFESIISGLCAGIVTFGALFITILHENKKDQIFWEREREKEKEDRLLSVRPFLNIEVKNISSARTEKIDNEKDCVEVGNGSEHRYARIILSNNGYGKCKEIELEGHRCSVRNLDIDNKQELTIYLKGIENEEVEFTMFFFYKDIFGNSYSQQFVCCLKSGSKELNIEIREPLLKVVSNEL